MIKIREARKSDLKQIKELEIEFLLEMSNYYPNLLKIDKIGKESSRKSISKLFSSKKYKFFVADLNGKLIGHVFGKLSERQKIYSPQKFGYIEVLYLKPEYRKHGIGKKLYEKMIEWFKSENIKSVELDASTKGKEAVKFWEKLGFEEILKKMEKRI